MTPGAVLGVVGGMGGNTQLGEHICIGRSLVSGDDRTALDLILLEENDQIFGVNATPMPWFLVALDHGGIAYMSIQV